MEVGLLSLGGLLPDPITGNCRTESERRRSFIDQAVLAEAMALDAIHLGEHHGSYQLSSPPVVLAAIGERTNRLRLSTGVTLVANPDPFRVAEDYATLDVLTCRNRCGTRQLLRAHLRDLRAGPRHESRAVRRARGAAGAPVARRRGARDGAASPA